MRNGGNGALCFGGEGTRTLLLCSCSSTKDWNISLIFVLGNLNVHLQQFRYIYTVINKGKGTNENSCCTTRSKWEWTCSKLFPFKSILSIRILHPFYTHSAHVLHTFHRNVLNSASAVIEPELRDSRITQFPTTSQFVRSTFYYHRQNLSYKEDETSLAAACEKRARKVKSAHDKGLKQILRLW